MDTGQKDPRTPPRLDDVGPAPPGVRELQELSPLIAAEARRDRGRRRRRWLLANLGLIGLGVVLATLGGCRIDSHARGLLAAERAAGIEPGTVREGWGPIELGPTDAEIAVLLVHGFRSTPADFGELPQRLADEGVFVRAMLLPGHGTSAEELATTTADQWIEAVREEYASLAERFPTVRVVGFSMGAACSLLALAPSAGSADEPGTASLDRLALVAPYFKITPRWWTIASIESWTEFAGTFVTYVDSGPEIRGISRASLGEGYRFYRVLPLDAASRAADVARRARDPELLGRYLCPILTVVANGDTVADPASARAAFDALGSEERTLVELESSNHVVFWDVDSAAAIAALVPFLTER
ncbi:Thermostable monoacylglycerol lipase [Planctomycetes bacterium Pla163]|uniref:Thermostable monoacylglycerol lipase n=1 Tax=Rohdeia mirabilis TaxID=2528008 RepID=A0A518D274_9BACT|nr:Thermostable monoacylglycerol lipase [Planctomycetes bacterium Pla163]